MEKRGQAGGDGLQEKNISTECSLSEISQEQRSVGSAGIYMLEELRGAERRRINLG